MPLFDLERGYFFGAPMSLPLDKEPFDEVAWEEVQAFDCGDKPYQVEVSDWLKAPRDHPGGGEKSALAAIHDPERPAKVWLYRLPDGTLIGFGALGKSAWRWKGKKDPRIPVSLIIWYAVSKEFQGKPEGPREEHYSYRIMEDLIAEAVEDKATHPVLGLCVDKENHRAIKLYVDIGFTEELSLFPGEGDVEYRRLAVVLDDEVLKRMWDEQKGKKK